MSINDGGPAFPVLHAAYDANGMSLRDWFAGQALSALADPDFTLEGTAQFAYQLADAMLKARELTKI